MTAVLSPRRWRAIRAVGKWHEAGGDLRGVPLDVVETGVADSADFMRRDLDLGEVERVCLSTVETWLADKAKKESEDAARAAYLAKRAADYRLTADPPALRRGERGDDD